MRGPGDRVPVGRLAPAVDVRAPAAVRLAPRVDRAHHALRAEALGGLADQARPRQRGGVERDLVGSREQQLAHAADAADAAADGQRDVDLLGRALDGPAEHAGILAGGRDVEPHDLVGALLGVAQCGLDGLAAVAQVDEVDALDDAAARDVEARDDALTQHRPPTA